ncbi:hypothetical protein BD310DRAFT_13686 [Dichomitus squalens]|uniref:Uncharacterized protein n=1 Tax=Dichomitus squalens TaxID=114155 RepID=A0A4V2K9W6_9APHY|nr:hypothetical protein BD310DRAFT_13686 [Dichomitus squalens]
MTSSSSVTSSTRTRPTYIIRHPPYVFYGASTSLLNVLSLIAVVLLFWQSHSHNVNVSLQHFHRCDVARQSDLMAVSCRPLVGRSDGWKVCRKPCPKGRRTLSAIVTTSQLPARTNGSSLGCLLYAAWLGSRASVGTAQPRLLD